MDAIDGPDRSFYTDGRHDELCELVSEVYSALGIKPWDDQMASLRRALGIEGEGADDR